MKFQQVLIAVSLGLAGGGGLISAQQPTAPPTQTGKGVIVGTIIDAVTNQPVANATVNVSADGNRTRVSVIADDQGRFVFSEAPAGHLFITSSETGYMNGYYGIRSPHSANQWFDLADGEKVTGVTIRMWKNAVVSGRVTDASDEPVVGASVMAARVDVVGGRTTLGSGSQARTDDRGAYRLANLTPGEFAMVLLSPASVTPASPGSSAPGYPTLFYPDTTSTSSASLLTLGGGEERNGVDFHITRHASFSISGIATGRAEGQSRPLQLSLRPADPLRIPTTVDVRRVSADAQGHFTFPGVLPGQYAIEAVDVPTEATPPGTSRMMYAQSGSGFSSMRSALGGNGPPLAPLPAAPVLWASVPIALEDKNLDDVAVTLLPGARISGRVVFEGAAPKPGETVLSSTPVMAMSADGRESGMLPASGIRPDGSFQTIGLPPGHYQVMFLFSGPGWSLASMDVAGREMISQALELGTADLTNVVCKFTDHPSQLSGVVKDENGKPAPDATLYLFSTDRRMWPSAAPMGRTTREVRPARNGSYQVAVPPGEYFVVAVEATAQEDWRRAEVLDVLAKTASTVKVALGQTVTLDLAVPKGK